MKSVHRLVLVTVTLLMAAGFLARAEATPIVSIDPASQTVTAGDTVLADILVSGLTEPIGAFGLLLDFDDSILQGLTFLNDPDGKMGAAPLDLSGGFGAGGGSPLDLFFSADLALSSLDLAALQGTGFRLGSVSFTALVNGVSALHPASVVLSNFDGSNTLPSGAVNGLVCVGRVCPTVPEPATLSLLGAGAIAALAARRRRSRASA